MTTAIFSDGHALTEEEFLAIGETPERIELFDGSLHVSPGPTPRHQKISLLLATTLIPAADAAGLQVLEAINLRVGTDRIPIPDLVISTEIDLDELVVDASDVRFVCEITSPSNASTDKVLKMHYYADAGIPWYLLIDTKARALHLYRLDGDKYLEEAACEAGDVLRLTEPVAVAIDTAELFPPV
ncbi:Uma2 family endonuclease [Paractinoplanes rhizophilus]|uniref:Uma2 family endonuclease n=1 Tax=Paractinoplanes rhizophilus TaxID=1416877 RepID=A0ABW2HRX4_9ACTN